MRGQSRGGVSRGKLPHAVSTFLAWPVNPQHFHSVNKEIFRMDREFSLLYDKKINEMESQDLVFRGF